MFIGVSALGWKFFEQFRKIQTQSQLLEKQEKTQMAFQQRIDLYDGRESRISFLEAYVDELKQSEHNSNVMFKKHSALFRSNTHKLYEIHNFICQTMETECTPNLSNRDNPQQTVQWLDKIHQDFMVFQQSLQKFDSQRRSFEEQENTIEQLRAQLFETEQNLSEHMEFLKVNQETVSRLTNKISKTTGIKLSKRNKNKPVKSKTGRGGPTILDNMALESPQQLFSSGNLRQFLYNNSNNYDSKVAQLEELNRINVDRDKAKIEILSSNSPTDNSTLILTVIPFMFIEVYMFLIKPYQFLYDKNMVYQYFPYQNHSYGIMHMFHFL